MNRKDLILTILTIIISIIVLFSLVQSFFYENTTIKGRFWAFIFITSVFALGSFAFVSIIIMVTHKFKEADKLNSSKRDFKTFKKVKTVKKNFKYILIIFVYIGFFIAVGTIISERAISTFLKPGLFPADLYAFLFLTGLIMSLLLAVVLMFFEAKITQNEN